MGSLNIATSILIPLTLHVQGNGGDGGAEHKRFHDPEYGDIIVQIPRIECVVDEDHVGVVQGAAQQTLR